MYKSRLFVSLGSLLILNLSLIGTLHAWPTPASLVNFWFDKVKDGVHTLEHALNEIHSETDLYATAHCPIVIKDIKANLAAEFDAGRKDMLKKQHDVCVKNLEARKERSEQCAQNPWVPGCG